jgi:arylsulfatase A-like enzyme
MTNQPNILFIFIDDLGWADLTCYGSSFYETPNLDRLAAGGLRFTDAYASCPVCSPTRASVLSGKYPARVGVTQWIGGHGVGKLCDVPYFHGLPSSERSLATSLRDDADYQTWHVGKWHLGERQMAPEAHGFDVNIGGCGWGSPKQGYFAPFGMPGLEDTPEGTYLTDALTEKSIGLIRDRDPEKPFFLNLWHYAVHTPIQAPADLVEKYQQKARALGLDSQPALIEGERFSVQHKRNRRLVRRTLQSDPTYAAMIENLDSQIGRLVDYLSAEGIAGDTLVMFSADNGGLSTAEGSPTCNAPLLEGKGWMYEGGNRVCQIASWPGQITPGQVTGVPVTSTDFYPTFLELAGLPPNPVQHPDGVSLAGLMTDGTAPDRDAIFWHYPHYSNQGDTPACAIRAGDWKLIEHFEDPDRLELFNLRADIGESTNLVEQEPERTRNLHARLIAWREEVKALIPEPNPNWVPEPLPEDCDPPEV